MARPGIVLFTKTNKFDHFYCSHPSVLSQVWLLCLHFQNQKCKGVTIWLIDSLRASCSHPSVFSQKNFHLAPLLEFSKPQMQRSYHILNHFHRASYFHPKVFFKNSIDSKPQVPINYHLVVSCLQANLFEFKCLLPKIFFNSFTRQRGKKYKN